MLKRCILFITAAIMMFLFVGCQDNSQADQPTNPTTMDIGGGVILHQGDSVFEEGTTVSAELVTEGTVYDRAQGAIPAETVQFTVVEITATKDGAAAQPAGVVTVTFPIPDGYSTNLALYYVSEAGAAETLKVTIDSDNKVVIAELTHFSTYVLVDFGAPSQPPHDHAFSDWKNDADSHWKECSCGEKDSSEAHSFGEWTITKETTETEDGSKTRTCAVCGYEHIQSIPSTAHVHTFDGWKSNADSHWKECSCGQKDSSASHSFGDWTVTKKATSSAEGSRYRTCSVCSYKQTETIPVVSHTHTFSRTSAGLKKGKCDICGKAMPIYNLGGEIYDKPGENLWLVVNENGSYDWYYEADVNATVEDYCNAEFANNYSSYRYPVMDLQVFDGVANHRYVLIFYIENGELKHIIPTDPNWDGVIPDNVVDPKEIFCSDGELRSTYEATVWSGYVIDNGTTTLGGKTEEYTVTLKMHTPRSKSFWEINRSGPTFYTYYTTSYSAPFRKLENNSSALQNTVTYNASGDFYTVSACTEKYYQAPDVYDLYYYQNSGLLSTITSGYSPKYYLYSDMTCEKINSTSAPLSKEIYQGLPYGLEFTLMSDNPNEVVTYKFVVDHPEFRNVTEIYKTVYTKHELYLVKSGSSDGYVLTDIRPS